jgi:GWxTD domain-containing protein
MTRSLSAALLALLLAASAGAATLPEMFKQAKDEFARGEYQRSLADFDALDAASKQPGYEKDRAQLAGVITFYRGANLAALGRRDEAKEAFIAYLAMQPNASIASPPFSRDVVAVFELARKEGTGHSMTVTTAYAAFAPPAGWSLPADEHWTETPVRYLLTPAQKQEYETLTTAADRATFVDRFWKQLDPTPATDDNEFRREFERRVAFADATWGSDKSTGRLSDRAAVFAFLGPPTYASMSDYGADDMSSLRGGSNTQMGGVMRGGLTSGGASGGGRGLEQDYNRGVRESWIYRGTRIPKGIAFQEVRFDFVTKQGYGSGVLQKDPQPMQTLGQAAALAKEKKALN